MNNKGQTLVLFLFIIPIIFLIFMVIYQVGTAELDKKKLNDRVNTIVEYGINHWSEEDTKEKMIEMLKKDFPKVALDNIEIKLETGKVTMTVTQDYEILFIKKQRIRVSYIGTNIDGKVQIVKE